VTLSVLHVSQPVDAGVARCVADLARDQIGRGWRVGVVCPDGPLAGVVSDSGAERLHWPASRAPGASVPAETRRLARIVHGRRPDLVHLHSSKAGLAGRLALRGRPPTVFQPHAWSFFALDGAARRVAVAWERFAARWTSAVVCVSEAEREVGVRAGIRANWRVIPNGVDLDAFGVVSDEERLAARNELDLDPRPVIVCIGRLSRQKGQDVLLDAWPRLRREAGAQLVLVGGGPEEERLRRRAEDVRFAGPTADVRRWLAAADLVVAPSRWEALSYVVLEAVASGRPVVATDVPGMRELLGEGGTIVPPEDSSALGAAIVERLGAGFDPKAGRAAVETRHDLRRATSAMADLYDELLGRSSQ
jgi:glycosyltransferase involved in cell wall biosynthesis